MVFIPSKNSSGTKKPQNIGMNTKLKKAIKFPNKSPRFDFNKLNKQVIKQVSNNNKLSK